MIHPSPTPHFILGAARSGKSSFAESLLATYPPPYVYVATALNLDPEMHERIQAHRGRRGNHWQTIEAPLELIKTLQSLRTDSRPVLVDCLTLWLSNLLLQEPPMDPLRELRSLADLLPTLDYPLYLVANEVGGGIVPDNPLARRFRDLAGLANQSIAAACLSVTLVVAGLPLVLK